VVMFEGGVPVGLDGERMDPVRLIERLEARAGKHGIGRGVHVGDTILGIKGRVAFEAPAAAVLIPAHRELEKLVLSRHQLLWKRTLGDVYGSFLHEARFFDPLMRDIEAFLSSSQPKVCGNVRVRLSCGQAVVLGATSPYSILNPEVALYGERASLWSGADAAAFAKVYGLQDGLMARVGTPGSTAHARVD
ncbi:MAG: argininosuccinate synthase, partial [bacterium]|nr:argininosuccinate synthase [bacterium]